VFISTTPASEMVRISVTQLLSASPADSSSSRLACTSLLPDNLVPQWSLGASILGEGVDGSLCMDFPTDTRGDGDVSRSTAGKVEHVISVTPYTAVYICSSFNR
jgi:hypothetical protein